MTIHIEPDSVTLQAETLAPLLEVAPDAVHKLMRDGVITSRFEVGRDEDAGCYRVTFWYGAIRARLTFDATGEILQTTRIRWPR